MPDGTRALSRVVLETRDVGKQYKLDGVEVNALRGVSIAIRAGEMVTIMGPSGSGKSTLMHIVGLLDQPTTGEVILEGDDVSGLSPNQLSELRNKHIGFVFQSFNLLARTTAQVNVELPLVYAGISGSERSRRAKEALERVALGDRLSHFSSQLSGGQQQRVAIARALVNNPSIVLADEPTGNLDTKTGKSIMDLLLELCTNQGKTIVMVTHDPKIAEYAARVIHIEDGLIRSDT
ncbi:MAG: macrolide ABC transporter ATP-binding protein [Candidatus Melainabacteria bacterium HGW-Melainabacteria-1]|nr:MAG: macrolide ABC transporter ATP-binding protein [Candidatus Melainabacteria bacterium HGW-Melainabacteria-1]